MRLFQHFGRPVLRPLWRGSEQRNFNLVLSLVCLASENGQLPQRGTAYKYLNAANQTIQRGAHVTLWLFFLLWQKTPASSTLDWKRE